MQGFVMQYTVSWCGGEYPVQIERAVLMGEGGTRAGQPADVERYHIDGRMQTKPEPEFSKVPWGSGWGGWFSGGRKP